MHNTQGLDGCVWSSGITGEITKWEPTSMEKKQNIQVAELLEEKPRSFLLKQIVCVPLPDGGEELW